MIKKLMCASMICFLIHIFCVTKGFCEIPIANASPPPTGPIAGCKIGNRIYTTNSSTTIYGGQRTVGGIVYISSYTYNYFGTVKTNCYSGSNDFYGTHPSNGQLEGTTIGCTVTGIAGSGTTVKNFTPVQCPLDDYVWVILLACGLPGFFILRKQKIEIINT